jgi:hypothetical protein
LLLRLAADLALLEDRREAEREAEREAARAKYRARREREAAAMASGAQLGALERWLALERGGAAVPELRSGDGPERDVPPVGRLYRWLDRASHS